MLHGIVFPMKNTQKPILRSPWFDQKLPPNPMFPVYIAVGLGLAVGVASAVLYLITR